MTAEPPGNGRLAPQGILKAQGHGHRPPRIEPNRFGITLAGIVPEMFGMNPYAEIGAGQIGEIVPETEPGIETAIGRTVAAHRGLRVRVFSDPKAAIAVVKPVFIAHLPLERPPSEVLAGSDTHAVGRPQGPGTLSGIVADTPPPPFVIDVGHGVADPRLLRRDIAIERRVGRVAAAQFQVERQRTVELPIGDRRRADRACGQRGRQRQRRDPVVDLGTHTHRIGHIGLNGEFRGPLDAGHIGLGHFDLLPDLGGNRARQKSRSRCGRKDKDSLHRSVSLAVRSSHGPLRRSRRRQGRIRRLRSGR